MVDSIFPLTLVGCIVLVPVGIGCLIRCRGKNHRRLVWAAAVFLGALALLFGGEILLGFFGLTWRSRAMLILCGTLLASGWVGIGFTLACALPMEMPNLPEAMRWVAKATTVFFAAVVFLVTLCFGPLALVLIFDNEERVVEYQGQTLLEVDDGFMDLHYSCYEYHGPLVRGTERIYEGPTHIYGDMG